MARNIYKKINFNAWVKVCILFEILNTKNLLPKKEEIEPNIYPIKFETPQFNGLKLLNISKTKKCTKVANKPLMMNLYVSSTEKIFFIPR